MNYIADTDVSGALNLTLSQAAKDFLNNQAIPAICTLTERYCNRNWQNANTVNLVETFDGGETVYFPSLPPINTVVSVVMDGETLIANTDYFVYPTYIELFTEARPAEENVVITYTTAANALPADVKFALVQWAGQMLKSQDDAFKQTTRWQQGPVQAYYKVEGDIPDFVMRVLDTYRIYPTF